MAPQLTHNLLQNTPFEVTDEVARQILDEHDQVRAEFPTWSEERLSHLGNYLDESLDGISTATLRQFGVIGMSGLALVAIGSNFKSGEATPQGSRAQVQHVIERTVTTTGESLNRDAVKFGVALPTLDKLNQNTLPQTDIENPDAQISPGLKVTLPANAIAPSSQSAPTTTEIQPAQPSAEIAPIADKLIVLGDSLSVGMNNAGLTGELNKLNWTVNQVDAQVGETVPDAIQKLAANAENIKNSSTVVLELGTNACMLYADPSCESSPEFEQQIHDMVTAIRSINPTAKIKWVNIYSAKGPEYQSINKAIETMSVQAGFDVIDWASEVQAHPDRFPLDKQMGVHEISIDGYFSQAQWIATQIGNAPVVEKAPTPTTTTTAPPTPTTTTTAPAPISKANVAPAHDPSTEKDPTLAALEFAQQAHNQFMSEGGYSAGGAAGAAGNGQYEGANPMRLQGSAYGSKLPYDHLTAYQLTGAGIGWGEFQETPPKKYGDWAKSVGQDPNLLSTQVSFVIQSIKGTPLEALLKSDISPEQAAEQFELQFERPQGSNQPYIGELSGYALTSLHDRQTYARALFTQYHEALAQAAIIQKAQQTAAAQAAQQAQQVALNDSRNASGTHKHTAKKHKHSKS